MGQSYKFEDELEGCMCEYVPEGLRERIEAVAEKVNVHTYQVAAAAMRLGIILLEKDLEGAKRVFGAEKVKKSRAVQKVRGI